LDTDNSIVSIIWSNYKKYNNSTRFLLCFIMALYSTICNLYYWHFILVLYIKLQYSIFFEFAKISPSQRLIKTLENKRSFFIKHCILVVLCGYAMLFIIHSFQIYIYEIVEFSVCILVLSSILIRKKNKAIKIHKNYTIFTFNYYLLSTTIICYGGYLILTNFL